MENFNPNNVNCPLCKKIKLRTIKDSKTNVVAYECIDGCGSTFIPDYKVMTDLVIVPVNNLPTVTTLPVTVGEYCFASNPPIILSWNYSDDDDDPLGTDPQSAYQVQIDGIDSGKVTSSSNQ